MSSSAQRSDAIRKLGYSSVYLRHANLKPAHERIVLRIANEDHTMWKYGHKELATQLHYSVDTISVHMQCLVKNNILQVAKLGGRNVNRVYRLNAAWANALVDWYDDNRRVLLSDLPDNNKPKFNLNKKAAKASLEQLIESTHTRLVADAKINKRLAKG
jgi:predicted ArsR family transcriptional regulator